MGELLNNLNSILVAIKNILYSASADTIILSITMIISLSSLVYTVKQNNKNKEPYIVAYIKGYGDMLHLVIENCGGSYAKDIDIDITEFISCGQDIRNEFKQQTFGLAQGQNMCYFISKAYITKNGITCKGKIIYKDIKDNSYEEIIDIKFGESTALVNSYEQKSILYNINSTLIQLNDRLKDIKETIIDYKGLKNIYIKLGDEPMLVIEKNMTFGVKILNYKDEEYTISKLDSDRVEKLYMKNNYISIEFNTYDLDVYKKLEKLFNQDKQDIGIISIDNKEYNIEFIVSHGLNDYSNKDIKPISSYIKLRCKEIHKNKAMTDK